MILELLGHKDYIRVLAAVERKPLRFTEIQKELDLNPTQVDRAVTFLRNGLFIIPKTVPADKGPVRVVYAAGKRGKAFLESFDAFQKKAEQHEAELGPSEVAELQTLSR